MKYTLLEPLRGIAALWVFAFHFHFSEAWQLAFPTVYAISRIGDLGVPMFFVISGFCIAAAAAGTVRNGGSARVFLYRRVRRIYPPFWCSIAVCAALPFAIELLSALKSGRYTPPSADLLNLGYLRYTFLDWLSVASLAQVFRTMPAAQSLQYKFTSLNAVYWTLAIEVQFYLIVSAAVLSGRQLFRWLGLVTVISLPTMLIPAFSLIGTFLPYWPMFAVGVLVFVLFDKGLAPSRLLGEHATALSVASLGLSVGGLGLYVLGGYPLGQVRFAIFFGIAIFCAEGLESAFVNALRWPIIGAVLRLFLTIGAMSYSTYLVHGRLQFLSAQLVRQVASAGTIAHDVAAFTLTIVGCYLFYTACERPFLTVRSAPLREANDRMAITTSAPT